MSKVSESEFSQWVDGTIQEVVPNPDEGITQAIQFMRDQLAKHRDDLFFWEREIDTRDGKFYFRLRSKSLEGAYSPRFPRKEKDKIFPEATVVSVQPEQPAELELFKTWKDGTIQELIPDGENLKEVCDFMRSQLAAHRPDLFFWEREVEERDEKFYVKLRQRSLENEVRFGRSIRWFR